MFNWIAALAAAAVAAALAEADFFPVPASGIGATLLTIYLGLLAGSVLIALITGRL